MTCLTAKASKLETRSGPRFRMKRRRREAKKNKTVGVFDNPSELLIYTKSHVRSSMLSFSKQEELGAFFYLEAKSISTDKGFNLERIQ